MSEDEKRTVIIETDWLRTPTVNVSGPVGLVLLLIALALLFVTAGLFRIAEAIETHGKVTDETEASP